MRARILAFPTVALAALSPGSAAAHAFGQRYDLPLPLEMFLIGAGSAVLLSFVVIALTFKSNGFRYPRLDLGATGIGRISMHPVTLNVVRGVVLGVFLLVVLAGLIGSQNQFKNIAPTMIWIIWWVGFAYVSALVGDIWRIADPIATLFRLLEALIPGLSAERVWPAALGCWPATALFFIFAWLEIVWGGGETPHNLTLMILCFCVISAFGMMMYGRDTWREHGDPFAKIFSLFARFAPFGTGADGRFELRPPAVGLMHQGGFSTATTGFVLLILATVTFDGFRETPLWADVFEWSLDSPLAGLAAGGINVPALVTSLGLVAFPLLFAVIYAVFCRATVWAAGTGPAPGQIAQAFIMTLVPIAIAYHLAHYISLLLISGQQIIPLVSDPFGYGWDLFGTAAYAPIIEIIDAEIAWHVAVTTIVLGHIAAVYLAHRIALNIYPTARAALRSQIPMLVLMVAYTMVSLWILAQPIVEI